MDNQWVPIKWFLYVAMAFLAQILVAPIVRIYGVTPNFMVIIGICAGLAGGSATGSVVGFWSGLLFDFLRPTVFGSTALSYSLVSFGAGTAQVVVLTSGRLVTVFVVAFSSIAADGLSSFVNEIFGKPQISTHRYAFVLLIIGVVSGLISRAGLWGARWAQDSDQRSLAE